MMRDAVEFDFPTAGSRSMPVPETPVCASAESRWPTNKFETANFSHFFPGEAQSLDTTW